MYYIIIFISIFCLATCISSQIDVLCGQCINNALLEAYRLPASDYIPNQLSQERKIMKQYFL